MITLEQAKELKYGDILHDRWGKRWKVNGEVQRWKKDPDRIRIPLKHGLYSYDAVTNINFHNGECDLLTLGEPPLPIRPNKTGQKGRDA